MLRLARHAVHMLCACTARAAACMVLHTGPLLQYIGVQVCCAHRPVCLFWDKHTKRSTKQMIHGLSAALRPLCRRCGAAARAVLRLLLGRRAGFTGGALGSAHVPLR